MTSVDPGPEARTAGRDPLTLAALAVATLCGTGRAPLAPGTAGSLVTLPLCWAASELVGIWGAPALGALLATVGVWAAGRVAALRSIADPPEVVVDEAAGMALSLSFLPAAWEFLAAAFLLFRILDVTKPWPADVAERLPGGLGVVADDVVAGLYTNLLLQVAAGWVLA